MPDGWLRNLLLDIVYLDRGRAEHFSHDGHTFLLVIKRSRIRHLVATINDNEPTFQIEIASGGNQILG